MITFFMRTLRRFKYALKGISYAIRNDFSYSSQFFGGIVFIGICAYFFRPITQTELFFLVLGWSLMMITELQNSSFEAALDRIHPEPHDDIGRSKDMAAGAVLTAGLFLVFIVVMLTIHRL